MIGGMGVPLPPAHEHDAWRWRARIRSIGSVIGPGYSFRGLWTAQIIRSRWGNVVAPSNVRQLPLLHPFPPEQEPFWVTDDGTQ
jgi:hypothetical protein